MAACSDAFAGHLARCPAAAPARYWGRGLFVLTSGLHLKSVLWVPLFGMSTSGLFVLPVDCTACPISLLLCTGVLLLCTDAWPVLLAAHTGLRGMSLMKSVVLSCRTVMPGFSRVLCMNIITCPLSHAPSISQGYALAAVTHTTSPSLLYMPMPVQVVQVAALQYHADSSPQFHRETLDATAGLFAQH